MSSNAISRSKLKEGLRSLANDLGRTPKCQEMTDFGPYSANTYKRHFGSWNNALREVGLTPHQEKRNWITDEELLSDLEKLADELNKTPTMEEMDHYGQYSTHTYVNHFGSWNDALREVGLEPNQGDPDKIYANDDRLPDKADVTGRSRLDQRLNAVMALEEHSPYSAAELADIWQMTRAGVKTRLSAKSPTPFKDYARAMAIVDDPDANPDEFVSLQYNALQEAARESFSREQIAFLLGGVSLVTVSCKMSPDSGHRLYIEEAQLIDEAVKRLDAGEDVLELIAELRLIDDC